MEIALNPNPPGLFIDERLFVANHVRAKERHAAAIESKRRHGHLAEFAAPGFRIGLYQIAVR